MIVDVLLITLTAGVPALTLAAAADICEAILKRVRG